MAQLALAILLLSSVAAAQTEERSPRDLVRVLTHQDRPQTPFIGNVCGIDPGDQLAARSLLNLGDSALPAIEEILDAVRSPGSKTKYLPNLYGLMQVYAAIRGRTALSRLAPIASNPSLDALALFSNDAIALSLGLTSYVSSLSESNLFGKNFPILRCRPDQPRDKLDELILGWESDDRELVESTLSPDGKAVLKALLSQKTWAELRAEDFPRGSAGVIAIGYRFEAAPVWSVPESKIGEVFFDQRADAGPHPSLDTHFTNGSGEECGHRRVKFLLAAGGFVSFGTYLVDDADLVDLLRIIGSCASQPK